MVKKQAKQRKKDVILSKVDHVGWHIIACPILKRHFRKQTRHCTLVLRSTSSERTTVE